MTFRRSKMIPGTALRAMSVLSPILLLPLLVACSGSATSSEDPSSAAAAGSHEASSTRASADGGSSPVAGESADDEVHIVHLCFEVGCSDSCAETPGVAGGSCQDQPNGTVLCVCDAPTCGALGEAPCADNYCSSGHFSPSRGICTSCGGLNQTCCNPGGAPTISDCYDGTGCTQPGSVDGVCVPCGGSGPICPSTTCGLMGQSACAGNVCTEGHYDADFGLCVFCGESGQQCCDVKHIASGNNAIECYDGSVCSGNLALATGSTQCDPACGGLNQAPCIVTSGDPCDSNLTLSGGQCVTCSGFVGDDGTCIPCVVGQPSVELCPASYCNDGTCAPGIITSCANLANPTCENDCGSHGGVSQSIGCAIE